MSRKRSAASQTPQVLLYHKPTGELVTRDDPGSRPKVFDLGVFAVVVGGTMLILTALSHQSIRRTRRPIAGEDGEAGLPEGDAGHRGTGDDTLTSS